MKKILHMFGFGVALAASLLLLQVVSFTLPNDRIRDHVKEASVILSDEGVYPVDFIGDKDTHLDNYTDALILGVAYDADAGKLSPLERALANTHRSAKPNPVEGLRQLTEESGETNASYTRYWFGTAGVARFLLEFVGLRGIRRILFGILFGLVVAVIILLANKAGWKYSVAFAVAMFLARPALIGVSLQFAPVFIVALIGTIVVCAMEEWTKSDKVLPYLFITMGMLTAFFDLLTCPLISLGLPLLATVLFDVRRGEKKCLRRAIKYSVIWALSYAGMYIFKWGVTSVVMNQNTFEIAFNQLMFRTDAAGKYSRMQTILTNYRRYLKPFGLVLLGVYSIVVVCILWKKGGITKRNLAKYAPFWVIILYPVAWYLVLSNHSSIHPWMTYRIAMISLLAYLFGTLGLMESPSHHLLPRREAGEPDGEV